MGKMLLLLHLFVLTYSVFLTDTVFGAGEKNFMKNQIVLAGGCFWGMEELFRKFEGVLNTEVGYAGGDEKMARYEFVKTGSTGHAEALRVVYDPENTNLDKILKYFFRIHDPTTFNRQGNDIGTQYRSAIFYADEVQKETAEKVISEIDQKQIFKSKIQTSLEPLTSFTSAEEYHQKYLQKNPGGYTCHFEREISF
jgi:methionine-S-sulfoxide reductase